ncbi:MAG TPA: pyridoxamine 5'-phosphate oxidase family protein [Pseudonocardia sp.]|jgi:nitroimidazol reductase NimA-like FMN-containing flavoprotein (pyridoxamine 5'-phosphate oxidase superfamily)|nr:pyridoxamine 5'-phosphate oxidase family protein [Pseudonocardia sp.]
MGVRLSEDEQIAFLERGHTGIITTLRRDGWPVSLPVWYAVMDGKVYLGTPPKAKKVARIRNDERCSFLVESGEKWVDLAAVEFRARAVIVEPGPEAEAAEAELARKYEGYGPPQELLPPATKNHYSARTVIRLDPAEPAISWDNQRIRLRAK